MREETFQLISRDGLKLFGRSWLPEADPVAVVCLIHGHGEHSGRYQHFGRQLTVHGLGVFGIDLRGHGLSQGKKGHTPSYDHLLEDVEDLMKKARVEYIETPMFLYGHSMGGNLVANFLTSRKTLELEGAVLSAPWLRLAFSPPGVKVTIGKIIRRLWPSFTVPSDLDVNEISSVPEEVEKYAADPLVHNRISAQLSLSIMEGGERAIEKAADLNIPVLLMHGEADKITSAPASQEFAARASGHATLKTWPGLKHEPHNEVNRVEVIDYACEWIKQRVSASSSPGQQPA